jgi:hypothetical protein
MLRPLLFVVALSSLDCFFGEFDSVWTTRWFGCWGLLLET